MFATWEQTRQKGKSLRRWMVETRRFDSTEPRDKVYALLGLSPPSDASAFEIEYDRVIKLDREVFKEATVHFLRTGENLEVLQ